MKKYLFVAFIFLAFGLQAQDKLTLRNGEILEVKIVEIGITEIKYRPSPFTPETPIIAIEKANIKSIALETGEVFTYSGDSFSDSTFYASQKKNALKINFLSPLNNVTFIGFERSIKPGQSIELEAGYIGLGWDNYGDDAKGAVVRFGWKFMPRPDFYNKGTRYTHLLKGGYIKPELIFSSYNVDQNFGYFYTGTQRSERVNKSGLAFVINFGKQWVFDDAFLVDVFAGVGYGGRLTDTDTYYTMRYGFLGAEPEFPIAITGGLRIGILIK